MIVMLRPPAQNAAEMSLAHWDEAVHSFPAYTAHEPFTPGISCPWRITNSTLYEAGNLQATIEAGFTTVQSLGAAIDKDVRDAINAGAIPGPRLLTSIHQITERIPWNQSSGESQARANQGAVGGGRCARYDGIRHRFGWSDGRVSGNGVLSGAIVQAWL